MADLDPLFDAILTELEETLELAIRPDRDQCLPELARRCEAMHRLAQETLALTEQKPLD
jgi:hypothetical protein